MNLKVQKKRSVGDALDAWHRGLRLEPHELKALWFRGLLTVPSPNALLTRRGELRLKEYRKRKGTPT